MNKVVFRAEVVGVVGRVDVLNVVQKAFEGLSFTVLIKERGECLVEFVERLYTREDIVGALEPTAHEKETLTGEELRERMERAKARYGLW